ncbi:MAG: NlpC/P60 family protein [Candidatus Ornithomonoglobus sp.]
MRNLKHTIIAIAAIVMVGTLSFFQVSDMSAQRLERDMRLSTANQIENITITSTESEEGSRGLALTSSYEEVHSVEEPVGIVDLETEQAIAEKSYLTLGYAKVSGSADLKTEPNEDSETIGTMNGAEQVEILESTEGWYKIMADGQSGYVKSDLVTLDKGDAEETALQYDHYKKANVTAASGLTVRASGSENAASLGAVNDGDNVIIVDQEGDYIKILYGDDYKEGYVINTGLETTGEWVEKDDVHAEIKRIAAEKAEAARKEEIAKQNAKNASSVYVTTDSSASSESTSTSSSSSKGQAIVNSAMKYLGVPYVWGGTSPSGFDCSGLVQYVCSQNGISVPRVAASQRGAGQYVSRENLQPGDLVFFSRGGGVSHVGIYIGNGNMIHAPQTGDVVKVSSIETSYRISSYAGAVRVW